MFGLKSVMDVMTPKGAMQIGAALESLANTPIGERILALLGSNGKAG